MSQAARKDSVLAAAAMPRGTRKSSRVGESTKTQKISSINDSVLSPTQDSQIKKPDNKTARGSKSVRGRPSGPSRGKIAKKPTPSTAPSIPPKDAPSKIEEQKRQREARFQERHARKDLSSSSPQALKQASRKPACSSPARLPVTSNAFTQTEVEIVSKSTHDAGTQTKPAIEDEEQRVRSRLSQRALRRLEQDFGTVEDRPLTIDQETTSSDESNMTPQSSAMSAASTTKSKRKDARLFQMTENNLLEQQSMGGALETPKNCAAIRAAIQKDREDSPNQDDFDKYLEQIFEPINEGETDIGLFRPFMDISWPLKSGHLGRVQKQWSNCVSFIKSSTGKSYMPRPNPDYTEGIQQKMIEDKVREMHPLILVDESMALPNFIAELKHHESMFHAHAQNRHYSAAAAQAWHKYYEGYTKRPEESLDIATVGSMEFNGDILVGNIHWASKYRGNKELKEPEYHMTRVMRRFVFGFNLQDFALARKEARNFRQYFFDRREELLEKFRKEEREIYAKKFVDKSEPQTQSKGKETGVRASNIEIPFVEVANSQRSDSTNQGTGSQGNPQEKVGRKRTEGSLAQTRTQAKKRKSNTSTQEQGSTGQTQELETLGVGE